MHRGFAAALVATVAVGLAPLPAQAATGAKGPRLSFTQGVYKGAGDGAGCDRAASYAEAAPPDAVTYCFTVTNTGTTSLASVTLSDPSVGAPLVSSGNPKLLAPGQTARWYLATTARPDEADGRVDQTFVNVATVSATPSDAAGKPLAGAALVTAQASTQVYPPEVKPSPALSLQASAYAGHDNGAHCPGRDGATAQPGEAVTWCFFVTNTGNTRVAGIAFADLGAAGSPTLVKGTLPLAPGASAVYRLEGAVPGNASGTIATHPSVRAAAVDDGGRELAGVNLATASAGASVQVVAAPTASTAPPVPNLVIQDASLSAPSTSVPSTTGASASGATSTTTAAKAAPAAARQAAKRPPMAHETSTGSRPQLAYTGWETWLIFTLGIGLVALGWLLTDAARRRSAGASALVAVPTDEIG